MTASGALNERHILFSASEIPSQGFIRIPSLFKKKKIKKKLANTRLTVGVLRKATEKSVREVTLESVCVCAPVCFPN